MSVTIVRIDSFPKAESPAKGKRPNRDTKKPIAKCSHDPAQNGTNRKIAEMAFYSEEGRKLTGIEKEGKVIYKIAGDNLAGRKLTLDFADHKDIKFKMGEKTITNEECFLLEMGGNNESIELYAEFIIK